MDEIDTCINFKNGIRVEPHSSGLQFSMWSGLCTLFFHLLLGGSFKIMVSVLYQMN